MNTPLAEIELGPPAFVTVKWQGKQADIDVYAARRMLEQAEKESAGDEGRCNKAVLQWLAEQTDCNQEEMAESTAIDFRNHICAIVARLNEERKKKVTSIVASLGSTPESPATTEAGR
jgi:head-tail adaptor